MTGEMGSPGPVGPKGDPGEPGTPGKSPSIEELLRVSECSNTCKSVRLHRVSCSPLLQVICEQAAITGNETLQVSFPYATVASIVFGVLSAYGHTVYLVC